LALNLDHGKVQDNFHQESSSKCVKNITIRTFYSKTTQQNPLLLFGVVCTSIPTELQIL